MNSSSSNSETTMLSSKNPSKAPQHHCDGPYRHQEWSFPDTIIYYIAMNPSTSKLYQKMIQTCKYFFTKNPVIICEQLIYDFESNEMWIKQNNFFKKTRLINHLLWITDEINIDSDKNEGGETLASDIVPKIYQCDIKYLYLWHQNILLKEFIFLASNAEDVTLYDTTVKNGDGSVTALEKLVQNTVKASRLDLSLDNGNCLSITSETVTNLLSIPHFSSLNLFALEKIPESFDIKNFFVFIKTNLHTSIKLLFYEFISEGYMARLEAVLNEILATHDHDYKPPFFSFPRIDSEKFCKLLDLSRAVR